MKTGMKRRRSNTTATKRVKVPLDLPYLYVNTTVILQQCGLFLQEAFKLLGNR